MIKTEKGCRGTAFSAGIDLGHWPEWMKKPGKLHFLCSDSWGSLMIPR